MFGRIHKAFEPVYDSVSGHEQNVPVIGLDIEEEGPCASGCTVTVPAGASWRKNGGEWKTNAGSGNIYVMIATRDSWVEMMEVENGKINHVRYTGGV